MSVLPVLNANQRYDTKAIFNLADVDEGKRHRDGYIDKEDLKSALTRTGGNVQAQAVLKKALDNFDHVAEKSGVHQGQMSYSVFNLGSQMGYVA